MTHKFTATLNGKEFTDPNEFFAALKNVDFGDAVNFNASYNSTITNEEDDEDEMESPRYVFDPRDVLIRFDLSSLTGGVGDTRIYDELTESTGERMNWTEKDVLPKLDNATKGRIKKIIAHEKAYVKELLDGRDKSIAETTEMLERLHHQADVLDHLNRYYASLQNMVSESMDDCGTSNAIPPCGK